MPELPEVETVKNLLIKLLIGRTITDIEVLRDSTIEGDKNSFRNALIGQTYQDITRIGKFLIFHLTNDLIILSHLRMEGKYYEYDEGEPNSKYARAIIHLDNNKKLIYDDSRCFGRMKLSSEKDYKNEKEISKLGIEPFGVEDISSIYKRAKKIHLPIKTALLSQELMTGLGNIYVDETLYLSHIHPHTDTSLVSKEEWLDIFHNAAKVMNKAIEMGGSTIKSYHPGKDIDGNFQNELQIYGKSGEICPICGHTFRFIKTNGRGTTFCPVCQIKKGNPIDIAITGKIGTGKSTVMNVFAKHGYSTISTDAVVKDLYERKEVANKIAKMFGLDFKGDKVDKNILREYIYNHPKDKKKLENYIHPLVDKEVNNILRNNKDDIRVVEVPRLFESKMDREFDVIIIVNSSKDEHQKSRDGINASTLKSINDDNVIDSHMLEAEFVINNDGSIKQLEKQVNQIINKLKSRLG